MTARARALCQVATRFALVLGLLKGLYLARHLPWLAGWIAPLAAVVLVYGALIPLAGERITPDFLEHNARAIWRGIRAGLLACLVFFPPFLLGNHFFQPLFFHHAFQPVFPAVELVRIALFQLLLVGFPEEFFFRGYLQSKLDRIFPLRNRYGVPVFPIFCNALLFAFAHSFITVQWWHFSIFFPALVFGWLREKTGGIVAPTIFHGLSNVVAAWIGMSYT